MARAYQRRQPSVSAQETRARIIAASRELLMAERGFAGFTIDAVAQQAGVARMTIYYQFGSKHGLLEAILDETAGRASRLPFEAAVKKLDPVAALDELVAAVAYFWDFDRQVSRRFYGLAVLDPDVAESVKLRDEQRRAGIKTVVRRVLEAQKRYTVKTCEAATALVYTLLRFETFDVLAGEKDMKSVVPLIRRQVRAALDLDQA